MPDILDRDPASGALVGVDVGGTKTHLRAIVDGALVDRIVPSDLWRQDAIFDDVQNFDRLAQLVTETVGAAPAVTVVGAHGIDSTRQRHQATALLGERMPGVVAVVNDAVLLAPAMGLEAAVCVIAGTGSAVVGFDDTGEPVTADGYGWLIADDASAPGISRRAAVALLRAVDRRGTEAMTDPLAARFLAAFNALDHVDLALRFQANASEASWGGFAPEVFAAAAAGSAIAHEVVAASAGHLTDAVSAVRARGARGADVIAAGGVITAQPLLADLLRADLQRTDGTLRFHVLDEPPVAGALALAVAHSDAPSPRKVLS
ncbi:N-acetylmuramic acid/N-acetylglucosamine kinase [Microbacterium oleivorans]|uniref:BadF/BadG/BcrA/BcrD ATPase family protein n=1 Tax=Microbacterium oleivorans TaxID=273677 RepID=UPI00097740FC|nr:BadF/BadG/BcrA/BcrD ATPase family protein [Microbacterium oleivorans]AZS45125.1 N-acetylmuramic acid/N-acetylglucosamine kinase [Microbacterium oleivorans]